MRLQLSSATKRHSGHLAVTSRCSCVCLPLSGGQILTPALDCPRSTKNGAEGSDRNESPRSSITHRPGMHAQHKDRGGGRERERPPDPRELDRLQGRARLRLGEELTYQEMLPAVLRNYAQVPLEGPCSPDIADVKYWLVSRSRI